MSPTNTCPRGSGFAAKWQRSKPVFPLLVLSAFLTHCSAMEAASDAQPTGGLDGPGLPGSEGPMTGGGNGAAPPGAKPEAPNPEPPPEVEVKVEFELPHAGDRYVYAANPDNDNVAVIDSETLAIQTVEAGDGPTFLQTLGEKDAAVVLNAGSNDATIIRTTAGKSTTATVQVQAGSNAIAVSPDGRRAVVYFNADLGSAGPPGSFQDISVLSLEEGRETAIGMTVGFRPSHVTFAQDGKRALVVTEDGVSILEFTEIEKRGAHIAETVSLGNDADAKTLDVSVTPDGRYALARREGDSQLRLANLETRDLMELDLAQFIGRGAGDAGAPQEAPITDVDLAPSGDFALAVVRGQSTVLNLPIPGAFDGSEAVSSLAIGEELIGSVTVSDDGKVALLYTTVVDTNERLSILDVETGASRTIRLPKAVEAVTLSPDGKKALVVHRKLPGNPAEPGLDPDLLIDRSYGYSLVQLDTGFSKLQLTQAALGPSIIVPDGSFLFALFSDAKVGLSEVHRIELDSFLVETIALGSSPISVGAVPRSEKVFVGQEHPDGRITFIDWNTQETESVTGFELNSKIRE